MQRYSRGARRRRRRCASHLQHFRPKSRSQHHHSRHAQTPQRRSQHRRQRPGPSPRPPPQTAPRPPLGPQPNKLEPMKNRTNSHTVIPSEARNLSSISLGVILKDYDYYFTRFASVRARRASGNARLVRASTVHDRRDRAAGRGVRRQSPAPPAPRLFACPRSSLRRRCRAFFRPRTSRASARTFHPVLPGWNILARKSVLLSARSWFSMCEDSTNHVHSVRRAAYAFVGAQHAAPKTARCQHLEESVQLAGAALRPKSFFESGNDFAAVIADLRFRERRLAALERHAHQKRIFSSRNIFPTEKIGRFDR